MDQREQVALRKESVDRNGEALEKYNAKQKVALRKESVDRNLQCGQGSDRRL